MQQLELMQNNKVSEWGSNPTREPFPTIDDAREKVQEAATILDKLSEFKHPLDVRKGRGVMKVRDDRDSIKVSGGSGRAWFIDVDTRKDGKSKYLKITERRLEGEGENGEWKTKGSIYVWPEYVKEFVDAVAKQAEKLG